MRTMIASHQPSKLSFLSKPAARTSEPGLSCRQRSAEIVADAVSVFASMAEVPACPVAALSRRPSSAIISGEAGDSENLPCALITPSGKVAAQTSTTISADVRFQSDRERLERLQQTVDIKDQSQVRELQRKLKEFDDRAGLQQKKLILADPRVDRNNAELNKFFAEDRKKRSS